VRAARRRSTSASVWAAEKVTRRREVPSGTVGGRMAGTRRPRASRASAAATAAASSPSTTGTMGDGWPGASRSTWPRSRARRASPSALRTIPRAAWAAAASAGERAVVKMKGRAVLTRRSRTAAEQATNPPSDPRALDSVPTRTSSRSGWSAGSRSGPSTAWASSSTRAAPWRAHSSARASTSAASPSMENTESATTTVGRSSPARAAARASWSAWGTTVSSPRASRHPSTIEAWLRASLRMRVPGPARAVSTPTLAA
jgi:hypothetical protein